MKLFRSFPIKYRYKKQFLIHVSTTHSILSHAVLESSLPQLVLQCTAPCPGDSGSSSPPDAAAIRYPMLSRIVSNGSAFIRLWLAKAASSKLSTTRSFSRPSWKTTYHGKAERDSGDQRSVILMAGRKNGRVGKSALANWVMLYLSSLELQEVTPGKSVEDLRRRKIAFYEIEVANIMQVFKRFFLLFKPCCNIAKSIA